MNKQHYTVEASKKLLKVQKIKLEIWDRAQREAARRHKSDWKDNFEFRSQQRHLANDPENCTLEPRGEWNCISLHLTHT